MSSVIGGTLMPPTNATAGNNKQAAEEIEERKDEVENGDDGVQNQASVNGKKPSAKKDRETRLVC